MIEIKIPKYRTVQLVFTASQVHSDLKGTYLPPYYGNLGRSAVTQVNAGDYILTDQFGRQWHTSKDYFKENMEEVKD